jgi:uncharacterized protein YgiM (DUF1202 family)
VTPAVAFVPTNIPAPTATPTGVPTSTPATAAVITPYGLNLRLEPSLDGVILTFLEEGTVVILLEGRQTAGDLTWQQVEYNGQIGWVSNELIAQD